MHESAPFYEKQNYIFGIATPNDLIIYSLIIICVVAVVLFILTKLLKGKPNYHSQEYWESRYSQFSKEMDWYCDFKKLCADFNIDKIISDKYPNQKKTKFLELGCGNSSLSHDLFLIGYRNLTSIDFSHVIISRMQKKFAEEGINCI